MRIFIVAARDETGARTCADQRVHQDGLQRHRVRRARQGCDDDLRVQARIRVLPERDMRAASRWRVRLDADARADGVPQESAASEVTAIVE